MKYTKATIGRTFLVRFEHGDDLLEKIKELVIKEDIVFSTIALLGAMSEGDVVCGPRELELPAKPTCVRFDDGREVVGYGTIVRETGKVHTHIHADLGRGFETFTGCLRDNCKVFITVEAVVTELKDVDVVRKKDPVTGHQLLFFDVRKDLL